MLYGEFHWYFFPRQNCKFSTGQKFSNFAVSWSTCLVKDISIADMFLLVFFFIIIIFVERYILSISILCNYWNISITFKINLQNIQKSWLWRYFCVQCRFICVCIYYITFLIYSEVQTKTKKTYTQIYRFFIIKNKLLCHHQYFSINDLSISLFWLLL